MTTKRFFQTLTGAAALAIGSVLAPVQAGGGESALVMSHPPTVTVTVGKAFTKAPGNQAEILKVI